MLSSSQLPKRFILAMCSPFSKEIWAAAPAKRPSTLPPAPRSRCSVITKPISRATATTATMRSGNSVRRDAGAHYMASSGQLGGGPWVLTPSMYRPSSCSVSAGVLGKCRRRSPLCITAMRSARLITSARSAEMSSTALPSLRRATSCVAHKLAGADVNAARGLRRDQQRRLGGKLAGHDHLLHVAARQRVHRRIGAGRADVVLLPSAPRPGRARRAARACRLAGEGRPVVAIHHQVVGDARSGATPLVRRSSGMWATPPAAPHAALARARAPAQDADFARCSRAQPAQHFGQLRLPVPFHTGNAQNFAG
jgi:hypothetical protein